MASIYFNPHLPQSYGQVVLRRRGDTVYFSRPPLRDGTPTPAMAGHQLVFADAVAYAKGIYAFAVRRAPYEADAKARNMPLFAFIMSGFLRDPIIKGIDTGGYHGNVGDAIVVRTRVDLPLASVTITLRQADGTEVESGASATSAGVWRYEAAKAVPAGSALTLRLVVEDDDGIQIVRTLPIVVA